jgi:hypothetical protein
MNMTLKQHSRLRIHIDPTTQVPIINSSITHFIHTLEHASLISLFIRFN